MVEVVEVRKRKLKIAAGNKNQGNGVIRGIGGLYRPILEGSKASFWEEMAIFMAESDIP